MKRILRKYYPHFLLAASLLLLLFLNLFYQDHWLDSDMAAEMIFSGLLAEEGRIFATPNWYYSTEFRFLYTHLVMGPLFRIFTDWHLIRTITNLVFYALMLVSYFYFVKPLGLSQKAAVLTSLFLLLPFSETMMIHMQLGNTYMSHVIILFFLFGIFLRLCRKDTSKKQKWLLLPLYLFLALVCGISGVRYLLALQCPLLLASFVYYVKSQAFQTFRKAPSKASLPTLFTGSAALYLLYSLIGFAASIVGYGVNALYIAKQYAFQTYESTNFISLYDGEPFHRLSSAIGALFMLFGYIPNKSVISLRGLISLIAFVLIGLLVYCTVKCCKKLQGVRSFLCLFFMTAFWVNLFVFVFTGSTMVPRYFITVFIFALPVIAFFFESEKLVFDKTVIALLFAGCLCLATSKTVLSEITVDRNASKRPVAEFLAENEYTFGYATYDYANMITELTDGQVEIANIWDSVDLNDFKWSSPKKYYEEGYHQGSVFLLLTREEAAAYMAANPAADGKMIFDNGVFQIFLFDSVQDLKASAAKGDSA